MTVNTYVEGSKKPLVIYHANCADGFSAAWCFWHVQKVLQGIEYEFYPGVYQQNPPNVEDRVVYLADFSYKNDALQRMAAAASKVFVIDHHASAIKDLSELEESGDILPNIFLFLDLNRSGATLAWDFLFPHQPRPQLLNHVEDRDLWKFKLPLTREIQAAVFSYEYTFENWDKLMLQQPHELVHLAAAGTAIERKHHKDIAELVAVCERMMCIGGFNVPAASLPYTLTSDAGHLMAKDWENGELFAACYWDTADSRIFSLRSTDNGMDVSEIAKQYGGGGHKHAAGFKVPREHPLARC